MHGLLLHSPSHQQQPRPERRALPTAGLLLLMPGGVQQQFAHAGIPHTRGAIPVHEREPAYTRVEPGVPRISLITNLDYTKLSRKDARFNTQPLGLVLSQCRGEGLNEIITSPRTEVVHNCPTACIYGWLGH